MNDADILVIEDDKTIQNFIRITLKTKGYRCDLADDGLTGISCFYANNPDLILLDLGLPDLDGMEVLDQIRQESDVPVIVVSARGMEQEKVGALDAGADDYITKPFSPKELVLRVNNIMKRTYKSENTRITIDSYELDEEQRKVFDDKEEIDLTTKEFDLLMMFIKNKGIAFSREKILENVWEDNYFGSDRVVDDTLRRLRKKLPKLNIHTIYGYGYRLG